MSRLPVRFTERALDEISGIMLRKNIPAGYALRVGAAGAGCSGVRFIIGFDTEKPGDASFEVNQVKVIIEKKHFLHLAGMKVDFLENETERGFVFESDSASL